MNDLHRFFLNYFLALVYTIYWYKLKKKKNKKKEFKDFDFFTAN